MKPSEVGFKTRGEAVRASVSEFKELGRTLECEPGAVPDNHQGRCKAR